MHVAFCAQTMLFLREFICTLNSVDFENAHIDSRVSWSKVSLSLDYLFILSTELQDAIHESSIAVHRPVTAHICHGTKAVPCKYITYLYWRHNMFSYAFHPTSIESKLRRRRATSASLCQLDDYHTYSSSSPPSSSSATTSPSSSFS